MGRPPAVTTFTPTLPRTQPRPHHARRTPDSLFPHSQSAAANCPRLRVPNPWFGEPMFPAPRSVDSRVMGPCLISEIRRSDGMRNTKQTLTNVDPVHVNSQVMSGAPTAIVMSGAPTAIAMSGAPTAIAMSGAPTAIARPCRGLQQL